MEKIMILGPFFEDPNRRFGIRELSRILKINHTSVRQHLLKLDEEGFISKEKEGQNNYFQLSVNQKTLNLKRYYNLEKIRKSKILGELDRVYDFPIVVLFGSYSSAFDHKESDVDLCIISNIKKDFSLNKYERKLNRKISIHKFDKILWEKTKKQNPDLINSICNGLVLSGQLEVL